MAVLGVERSIFISHLWPHYKGEWETHLQSNEKQYSLLKSDGKILGNLQCPAGEHLVDAVVFLIKYSAPVGC